MYQIPSKWSVDYTLYKWEYTPKVFVPQSERKGYEFDRIKGWVFPVRRPIKNFKFWPYESLQFDINWNVIQWWIKDGSIRDQWDYISMEMVNISWEYVPLTEATRHYFSKPNTGYPQRWDLLMMFSVPYICLWKCSFTNRDWQERVGNNVLISLWNDYGYVNAWRDTLSLIYGNIELQEIRSINLSNIVCLT